MLRTLRDLYERMPAGVRKWIWRAPQPFALTRHYHETLAWLRRYEGVTPDLVQKAQFERLAMALVFAVESVPFYRELFGRRFTRDDIASSPHEILREFPIVSKEDLRDTELFLSERVSPRDRYPATTGGSSGEPLTVWHADRCWSAEWAFVYHFLERYGITPSDIRVSLRGVRRLSREASAIEENPIYKEVRVSPFHLFKAHREELIAVFCRYRPRLLHGYPSAIRDLLVMLDDEAPAILSSVRVILLISESVSEEERAYIEQRSGCEVASFYGHTERACFAPWNGSAGLWVPNPLYGATEIVSGRLVATGFHNDAMPMVRYDTGDEVLTEVGLEGRLMRPGEGVAAINGRWGREYLVGRNGQKITMASLNTHISEMSWVRRFQFRQRGNDVVTLLLCVREHERRIGTIEAVRTEFERKSAGELKIVARAVDEIPLTISGKHRFIVRDDDAESKIVWRPD